MKYEKPEITALGTAMASIHGMGKEQDVSPDNQPPDYVLTTTIAAYQVRIPMKVISIPG